ncbi:MAG TPA: formate dehydrogenase subunit alpha [Terriglobia bacterium]|nr:formate dehydrogenase subunit alpha [Terriglobia bacterium]
MKASVARIDDVTVEVQNGETILQAAKRVGIEIPTLCYSEGLAPEGGCRVCIVETNRSPRPSAACHTLLQPGMEIRTKSPKIESLRRDILALYLESDGGSGFRRDHRDSYFTALLERYGLSAALAVPGSREAPVDTSHVYLRFSPHLCINCRRCLNACEQIQGQFVYGMAGRGPLTHLIFGSDGQFADSACVACGACIDQCPTAAISDRDRQAAAKAESVTQSVCGYCGVGCRVEIAVAGNQVLRIKGVANAAVNRGHLCVKGRYAHAYHHSKERLTRPLMRVGDDLKPISWDDALEFAARRLVEIRDQHGPDALGVLTSSRSTNEACYLLQKLFRSIIGTNNVDCCARVCHSSSALALQITTGTGAASASYADIDCARCIVLAGANPTEAHPVVGARIKQAALRGARLLVIDPRRIELADYADVFLQVRPGTNVALFNALAKVLIEDKLIDASYVAERTDGFEDLRSYLSRLSLHETARVTGVTVELIQKAARLLGGHSPALFVNGLGLSELTQGTASVKTFCNLGMLTGSIGRPGAGMLPLRGQNNVQGSADMGSMPRFVTGYQSMHDPDVRERLRQNWGDFPPQRPGLTVPEMIDAAARNEIRALWIQGEDIVQSDPHQAHVIEALSNLDFLVVQELFLSETTPYADLVLPAASVLEQEGTFTNGERRIQLVRPAVRPPGEARPDWVVIRDLARILGASWNYETPAEVMNEIARVAPALFGGVSYERLAGDGLQWPCPDRSHPGTASVHASGFICGKGRLTVVDYVPSPEQVSESLPYILVTGRVLEHYNAGTMTRRTPQQQLVSEDLLEIHPDDAAREGISEGETVELKSRWGRATAKVHVSTRPAPRTLFLPFHFPETHTNCLTGPHVDPDSKCPEYKVTAVRVRVLRPAAS